MITKKYNKTKGNCKVTFSLTKEQVGDKRDVRVLADFNDWSWIDGVQLKNGKGGKYSGSVELPAQAAHYQFRYLVDGQQWMNDPDSEGYQPNVHGTTNCIFELEGLPAPVKKAAKKPAAKKAVAKKAPAKKAAPKKAAKATTAKADDLKRIEGIGPKIAGLLNDAGITTFAGLGKASTKKLKDVLEAAGPRFRLAKPDTWKQQAKLAAAGKDTELKKLQDELKGGVKK
ncbi:glycoside hydrolase family 13 [Lewinellaceae bacterium SD302]|nr:glycoside hydrolase family 13 [Lewinellaceae bacterium SD302]